ncbi:hypothetical protein CRG98_013998 [Punica granatum]|uniref:SET domain-containing protein n=1 Tax=Punica granatum TaxID=22663 RepID=A0A2I0KAP4_PUNGR|nr:hypothetical protein CRG98_013998 [Punica granatum]
MPTAENAAAPLLNVAEMQGRGRALVAAQPLRGGQVVLRDSPILLYSALPFTGGPSSSSSTTIHRYCDHCFRALQSAPVLCPSCRHHAFCSPACLGVASVSSHSPWACQTLARLIDCSSFLGQPPELQVQARFLVASYNLSITSPEDFQVLQSLQGRDICSDDTASSVQLLHPLIASVCPPPPTPFPHGFSPELSANLLSKDKLNAFGLMEPFGAGGERSVRAYGIYPRASFFNHDCLPNACRFDYVDTVPDHNTDIVVRMIHDVPQGREICGSSDADIEAEKENDFPHEYFFVRYVCNRENCFGTLAPLPPSADGAASEIMECNVCGQLKRANDGEEEEMGE